MTVPCAPVVQLWVFAANHPDIQYILMSAKEHGACLLIKHAEKNQVFIQSVIKGYFENRSYLFGGESAITHHNFR